MKKLKQIPEMIEDAVKKTEEGLIAENMKKQSQGKLLLDFEFNPNWHELWKQEECSYLAPPKGICNFLVIHWTICCHILV